MAATVQSKGAGGGAPPSYVKTPAWRFLVSLPVDRRLARYDIAGSLAHVEMLAAVGLLSKEEAELLGKGLRGIYEEIAAGRFAWREQLEDVHTNIEVALAERLGSLGAKLHMARSRNDQIALDERLFLREAIVSGRQAVLGLELALLDLAEAHAEVPMPGYTHLQRAQPVSLAHHLLAHVEAIRRDRARVAEARDRTSVSPLGAAALAGSPYPVDPASVAKELGLERAFRNSIDAVSDRDFVAELAFVAALSAVHASRLAEELVLWTSAEFGYAELSDEHATGSSIMPQKKNPDVPELVRGRAGRIIGDLVAVLTTLKGLPLAYGSDLQEQRVPLYDATEVAPAIDTLALVVRGLRFDRDAMRRATERGMLGATDLADHLARRGVPFREAHEIVGRVVRERIAASQDLGGMTVDDLRRHDKRFEASALEEIRPD